MGGLSCSDFFFEWRRSTRVDWHSGQASQTEWHPLRAWRFVEIASLHRLMVQIFYVFAALRKYRPDGGECWEDVRIRAHKWLHTMARLHLPEHAADGHASNGETDPVVVYCVAHGGFIMETINVVCQVTNTPNSMRNASLTTVYVDREGQDASSQQHDRKASLRSSPRRQALVTGEGGSTSTHALTSTSMDEIDASHAPFRFSLRDVCDTSCAQRCVRSEPMCFDLRCLICLQTWYSQR